MAHLNDALYAGTETPFPRRVDVNGRTWEIGRDGTLKDRRRARREVTLTPSECTALQAMRCCDGTLPLCEVHSPLESWGFVGNDGLLTDAGREVADRLLRSR